MNLTRKNNGFFIFDDADYRNNHLQKTIFRSHNYASIDPNLDTEKSISLLCKYDHPSLLESILKNKKIDVNLKVKNSIKKVKLIDQSKKSRTWKFNGRFSSRNVYRFSYIEEEKRYLNIAIENGSVGVIPLLLNEDQIDVNSVSTEEVWWHLNFQNLHNDLVKTIYEKKSAKWWKDETPETVTDDEEKKEKLFEMTPLNAAIVNHDDQTVELLLKNKSIDANLRSAFRKWRYLFDEGRRYGKEMTEEFERTPLFNAVEVESVEIVKLLIECKDKIDINMYSTIDKSIIDTEKHVWKGWDRDIFQKTPLHEACEKTNLEIVQLLLSKSELEINKKLVKTRKRISYESDHNIDDYQINKWKLKEKVAEIEDDYKNRRKEKYDRSYYKTYSDYDEKTALDVAVRKKNRNIISLLRQNNAIEINTQSASEREKEELDNLAEAHMQDCNIY